MCDCSRTAVRMTAPKSICPILTCVRRCSRGAEMVGCRCGRKRLQFIILWTRTLKEKWRLSSHSLWMLQSPFVPFWFVSYGVCVVPKRLDADLEEKANNSSFCEHEHWEKNEGSQITVCVDALKSICPILICVKWCWRACACTMVIPIIDSTMGMMILRPGT